jgi:hypothetical protein
LGLASFPDGHQNNAPMAAATQTEFLFDTAYFPPNQ